MSEKASIEHEIVTLQDEADLISKLHDDTINQEHSTNKCAARCLKMIMPVYIRWIDDEFNRGTDYQDLIQAQSAIVMSIMGTMISNVAPPENFNKVLAIVANYLGIHLGQVLSGDVKETHRG